MSETLLNEPAVSARRPPKERQLEEVSAHVPARGREFVRPPFARRIVGGLRRRFDYWSARIAGRPLYDGVERGVDWIDENVVAQITAHGIQDESDAALLGQTIGTFMGYGLDDRAREAARVLIDGISTDALCAQKTAGDALILSRIAWGLASVAETLPDVNGKLRAVGDSLARATSELDDLHSHEQMQSLAASVGPLCRIARQFRSEPFQSAANLASERLCAIVAGDRRRHRGIAAWVGLALFELEEGVEDQSRLPPVASQFAQTIREAVVAQRPQSLLLSDAARLALGAFTAPAPAADSLMNYLRRRQRRDGALSISRHTSAAQSAHSTACATLHFLDAAKQQAAAGFRSTATRAIHHEFDAGDARTSLVLAWAAALRSGARVVDVGCGRGRYLKLLGEFFPDLKLTGTDLAAQLLAEVRVDCDLRQGSMLRLPAARGEFDAALAVESLEHSLLPRQAIAEMCRVVRPGGEILVIDKHLARQPTSQHEPWERWFAPDEVARWLSPWCDNVRVEPLVHEVSRRSRPLFLVWRARRKST